MLSSLLGPSKGTPTRPRGERSPFSSPFTSSPEATRRSQANERRRTAAGYDTSNDPDNETTSDADDEEEGAEDDDEEEEEEEEDAEDEDDEDEDEDEGDEDGAGDTTPLLPIFSAAHLGSNAFVVSTFLG